MNTDDFLTIAEQDSGMQLDWFFELYLRQPKLPKLVAAVPADCTNNCSMLLRWETPNNISFPMPVDVVINGKPQRIEMKDGKATVTYTGAPPAIDPKGWVLKMQ